MQRRSKKTVRPSRLSIDNRIFVRPNGAGDAKFYGGINSAIRTYDFFGRRDLLCAVAQHPNLPLKYMPVYGKNTQFHGSSSLKEIISRENYPYWIIGIFAKNSKILNRFLVLRRKINSQILRGDAIGALNNLVSLSSISESWWSIETSIHINKELLSNDTKGYIKQLQEMYPHLNLSRITRDLLLLSESNNAQLYIEAVQSRIKEYMSSTIVGSAQRAVAESVMLLPIYHDISRKPTLDALYDIKAWSIFDQYLLFQNLIMEMHVTNSLPEEWLEISQKLATEIEDHELFNVIGLEQPSDTFIEGVVAKYTRAEYSEVINDISNEIASDSIKISGLIEIYARSKIYTSTVGVGTSFLDHLADEFAKVLTLDSKSSERLDYLHKICVKFRSEPWSKSLLYHIVSIPEWRHNDDSVERLRLQTACLGPFNTPKARVREFEFDEQFVNDPLVPEYRLIHYLPHDSEIAGVTASKFPIYSDYLKVRSRALMNANLISQAWNFSINEYLTNNVAFNFLPIVKLAEIVSLTVRNENFDYVSSLIILDIYARECDQRFDELKVEIFEEFLDISEDFRPSVLFSPDKIDHKISYFLRNLCIPAQLDNIIQFNSNDEVIHERVAIIDLLIAARAGNIDELRLEKDKVLETLFSEKLRAKIETGKLYVDVQALETRRRHIYISLFEQAKSLAGGVDLEPLVNNNGNIDSSDLVQIDQSLSVPVAVASSEKSSILVRIFNQAVHDFALDENYGLDKYLSAEIRHIVFVTQLRACFERAALVTPQKGGEYLPNDFWKQKYDFLSPAIISELDLIFSKFSKSIDEILTKVNDQFRIKAADLSSDHIFDFCPYHTRIVKISEIVKQSEGFDIFMSSLISFMWELAVESAYSAQELINDLLSVQVLSAIDQLEEDINELKGNFAAVDLMQSIRDCRSDFKKEVELVLNWFRFVGSEDAQTLERLGVVIEAAVSSFQAIFEHKGVELTFTQEKTDLQLNYSEARSLFISLFTALENALKYGEKESAVTITHARNNDYDELIVMNNIGIEIIDQDKFVGDIKAKWTTAYSKLSIAEGGSGIYKIYNLLSNASRGFDLDISISDNIFSVLIGLRHEYFDNRR